MSPIEKVSEALVTGLEGVAADFLSFAIALAIFLVILALIIAGIKKLLRKIFHK